MLQALARSELAIDLGTAATRLHAHPRTVPLTRPSVVWRGGGTRPALARGVVVDGDAAADVLGDLLRKVGCGWRRPRAVACVPSDASDAEQDAVLEAVRRAGAARVALVPEPLAAAVGAGIEVGAPRAQALVDIGEGVTDCAVVCEGRIVASDALRVAVADLRHAMRAWIAEGAGLRLSAVEIERVLRVVGVGRGRRTPPRVHVVGSPPSGSGPVRAWLDVEPLHAAIEPLVERIAARIAGFVSGLPEPIGRDVIDAGLCLTGGGALLAGMVERIVGELDMAVWRAPDPLLAVVDGARAVAAGAARIPLAWR